MRILHSNKAVYLLNERACAVRVRSTLYMATAAAPSRSRAEGVPLSPLHTRQWTLCIVITDKRISEEIRSLKLLWN